MNQTTLKKYYGYSSRKQDDVGHIAAEGRQQGEN